MNDFDYWIPPVEDVEKAVAGLEFADIYMLFKDNYVNILFCGGTFRDYCAKDHVNFCLELMGLPTINDLERYSKGPNFKIIRPDDCGIPYYYNPQWSIAFQVPLKDGYRLYNYLKEISPLYVTKEQWKKVYSPNNPCILNDAEEGFHQLFGAITVKNRNKYSSGYHLEINDDIDNIYKRNKALADIPADSMILMGQDGMFYVAGPHAMKQMYQVMAPENIQVVKDNQLSGVIVDPRFSDSVPKNIVDFAVWVASADFPDDESMPIDLRRPSTYIKNLEEPDIFSRNVMKDFMIGVEIF